MAPSRPLPIAVPMLVAAMALAACGGDEAPGGMPPVQVSTLVLEPEVASISSELPGRLSATRIAEVRARVPGIVLERVFTEGSEVEAGDVLFRIDPAPLRAELASAQAGLAQARANASQASALARRYEQLIEADLVSRQDYEAAVATGEQARASVAAAQAAVEQSRIQLGYAEVVAPISGRVGRALVTEGALVGQGDPTPLARIQQIDPMYADVSQSTSELRRLQNAFAAGHVERVDASSARVSLVFEDGSTYPQPGRLLFSDISVDPGTGQVGLRAEFPNPDRELLPGGYARVRIEQATATQALLVPKQAVQRNPGGDAFVTVVEPRRDEHGEVMIRPDGTFEQVAAHRTVQLGSGLGARWIVETGLAAGDEIVVEGFQRAAPGTTVATQPWQPVGTSTPQTPAAPATATGDVAADAETGGEADANDAGEPPAP